MEPSYLEDFLHHVQVENLGGEITSILKVVANLRSSHINHLDVEVLRMDLPFLVVAKHSGLSWDIVKYVSVDEDKIIGVKF